MPLNCSHQRNRGSEALRTHVGTIADHVRGQLVLLPLIASFLHRVNRTLEVTIVGLADQLHFVENLLRS